LSIYLAGLLWVVGAAALAAVVAFVVRKYGPDEGRPDNNESVGNVFTLVGGLHAVIMAFVLISLFDAGNGAQENSFREANALVAVSWAAESLPEPARGQVQQLTRDYANTVITQEWPRMRRGDEVLDLGWAQLDELRVAIDAAPTGDDYQQGRKEEAVNQLWEVYQARQDRLNSAGSGVSVVVWFALAIGSLLTVALPYLFGGSRLGTHVLISGVLAGTVAMLLFAIFQLQNPFSGGSPVEPDAFRSALDRLG
jgi:Protein of unknown function (DUF4239)